VAARYSKGRAENGEDRTVTDEHLRIRFLTERDGAEATRVWVARTLKIYREALQGESNYTSLPEYRSRFEEAIRAFEEYLAREPR